MRLNVKTHEQRNTRNKTPAPARQHVSAIHVLRGRLGLTEDDYRALLMSLVGQSSTLKMTDAQRAHVRKRMQSLLQTVTDARGETPRETQYQRATPQARKAWALWNQLHRDGHIADRSARAFGAWVKRQVGMESVAWCNDQQIDAVIEALKVWGKRSVQPGGVQPGGVQPGGVKPVGATPGDVVSQGDLS